MRREAPGQAFSAAGRFDGKQASYIYRKVHLLMTTIEEFTSQYGLVKKIDAFGFMKYLHDNPDAPRKHGKVVLVTADTPLKASRGEGKTTTTIALIDALRARGIDATAVLRQPSMGITAIHRPIPCTWQMACG